MADEQTPYTPTTSEVRRAYGDNQCVDPDDMSHAAGCPQDVEFDRWLAAHDQKVQEEAWREGVSTALNYAIRNPDGVTLRLEHLDGRPWMNPYTPKEPRND